MSRNGFVKTAGGEKKKASVKEIGWSYFNFRPGTACVDLKQDLTKKWWIKNKQSPAGIQEENGEDLPREPCV